MDEYLDLLNTINGKLDRLLEAAPGPTPADPPAGFVAVRPTGPRGVGKVRYWPQPVEVLPNGEFAAWAYADRCNAAIDPATGMPLYPKGRYASIGPSQAAWGLPLPETLDRLTHEIDWETQAELDMRAAQEENDRRSDETFNHR